MEQPSTTATAPVRFETHPSRYVHWKLEIEAPVARLLMDVQEDRPLRPGYPLKRNSYDLGRRHRARRRDRSACASSTPRCGRSSSPAARTAIFCAGANIYMLGSSTHAFKVNFCKFTNETRLSLEDASRALGPASRWPR